MIMSMVIPWYFVLLTFACGGIILYLSVLVYQRKHISGHSLVWVILVLYAIICLTFGLDNLGMILPVPYSISVYLFWINTYCYFALPVAWFLFCLHYIGKPEYLTVRNFTLLMIIPVIMSLFRAFSFGDIFQEIFFGPYFSSINKAIDIIGYGYIYGLSIVGNLLLIRRYPDVSVKFRHQIIFLITSSCIILIGGLITDSGIIPSFDPMCLEVALSGFILAFGILHYDLLHHSPIFREKFFDIANSGLIALSWDRHIIDMNPVAEKLLQISLTDAFSRHPSEILSLRPELRKILEHPDILYEQPFSLIGDEIRWYSVSFQYLQKNMKNQSGYLVVFTDITNSMNLEKQVQDTKIQLTREKENLTRVQKYREFFMSHRDAIIIISKDRIIEANPLAYEMFSEFGEDIIGMDPVSLSADHQRNPDDVPEKIQYYYTQALSGRMIDFSWVFQSHNEEIPARVRLSRLVYDDQILIEMSISDMSDMYRQLDELTENNQSLMNILSEEIHLWSLVSDVVLNDSDTKSDNMNEMREIIVKATRNIEKIVTYQNPTQPDSLPKAEKKGFRIIPPALSGTESEVPEKVRLDRGRSSMSVDTGFVIYAKSKADHDGNQ